LDIADELVAQLKPAIRRALEEDLGDGDVTTRSIVPSGTEMEGRFIVKADGVVAGLAVAALAFALLDERVRLNALLNDGHGVTDGQTIATVRGPGQALLSGERVALNFLQRMSGIATLTRRFVKAVAGTPAVILDTRKTAPGLRVFDKWAVSLGGGQNHRFGLFDMALIKENHIAAAGGSITQAVNRLRVNDTQARPIEVEVATLVQLEEALALNVDRIMLDNMNLDDMGQAVRLTGGRIPLEASGGVSLARVAEIAATGVDFISVGALTHSVQALDISLLLQQV
jgi:nicotinate-nucleotide pyrophosphorylase (carboxylating)